MLSKKITFVSSDAGGCMLYRCKYIAEYLNQEYSVMFPFNKADGRMTIVDKKILDSDILVIQRHNNPVFLEVIPLLKKAGKKIVYDIDDNLWSIPSSNLASAA